MRENRAWGAGMGRRELLTGVFWAVVAALLGIVAAQEQEGALQNAEQWKEAALGRRSTAAALQEQANELLRQASELRAKDYLTVAEGLRNLNKAGDGEMRAGDRQEAASVSYAKEADNWQKAALEYSGASRTNEKNHVVIMSAGATRSAQLALQQAVDNYLLAAEAYRASGSGGTDKAEAASEKAAALAAELEAAK